MHIISPQSERSELGAFYFCPGVLSGYCCVCVCVSGYCNGLCNTNIRDGDGCEVALNLILIRVRCKFPSSSPRPPVNRANRGGIRSHSTKVTPVLGRTKPIQRFKRTRLTLLTGCPHSGTKPNVK